MTFDTLDSLDNDLSKCPIHTQLLAHYDWEALGEVFGAELEEFTF